MSSQTIWQLAEKLYLIALTPPLQGFDRFIGIWLYTGAPAFLVDVGPAATSASLLKALGDLAIDHLDYLLLTHIHIDHAGGTGELLKFYPQAKVICHPQGSKHLVAPENLWQGSKKVLGKLAEAYGEIIPVPEANIEFAEQLGATGIRCFLTPGHAQHHCCYLFDDLLFGGEVTGVHCQVANGIYMRPATPPKFILEIALDSVQRMIDLQPRYLVIAHYGLVEPAVEYLKIGREQLNLWVKGAAKHIDLETEDFKKKTFDWLMANDLYFQNIDQLDEDIRARERYFLDNSLRGMNEYVASLDETTRQLLSDH